MRTTWNFVALDKGRLLEYAEYGDPEGAPLVYCHGFPSSGREAMMVHPVAMAEGARIIAPNRPGFGRSDHQPDRTILDWAADVASLADLLGLDRIGLIGLSGGAPYALACVQQIPERINACALVCPLGPIYREEVLAEMDWTARVNFSIGHRVPLISELMFGPLTAGLLSWWPGLMDHYLAASAPIADRTEMDDTRIRHIVEQCIQDAMENGARGPRQDVVLYTNDWEISMESIAMPIDLWHGEADGTVPVAHSRWYAANLPNTREIYLPDEGHYSLPLRHSSEIIRNLLGQPNDQANLSGI
jgi:pimeloyl-ACP methyl ester carboxylesterase